MKRYSAIIVAVFAIAIVLGVSPSSAQNIKQSKLPAKVLSAKSAYFDDRSGAPAMGHATLVQLQKWGRFQIVSDRRTADVVLLLSADPYKGGYVIYSGGQTGTVDKNGEIQPDPAPTFYKQTPTRYAYLTVVDPTTGNSLWSGEHVWGGLLTGFNSAGARLVDKLRKQVER